MPSIWTSPSYATVPTCFGKPATIIGTAGTDNIYAGRSDVVYGGGNDYIVGGYLVCGGAGADSISADMSRTPINTTTQSLGPMVSRRHRRRRQDTGRETTIKVSPVTVTPAGMVSSATSR
jgi:hypothetical protein